MLTIKYAWLIVVIVSSALAGAGTVYVFTPSPEAVKSMEKNCEQERNDFKRAPVIHSPSRGF